MRYTALVALTTSLALLGCKQLQPSPSSSAPAQPGAQPGAQQSPATTPDTTGGTVGNTAPAAAQPPTSATAQAPPPPAAQPLPATQSPPAAPPPTKGAAKTTPQPATSPSQTSPPKSADGNSMPPTRRNSGNPPKETTQPAANSPPPAPERPSAAAAPQAPALDLNSLKERLKDTRAIGLFTKLSLKNQVDDLLTQLRAFHAKKSAASLAELRQRYDLLLLKVLSLLQDGDPPLATAISQSRDSIWSILSDPQQFAKL